MKKVTCTYYSCLLGFQYTKEIEYDEIQLDKMRKFPLHGTSYYHIKIYEDDSLIEEFNTNLPMELIPDFTPKEPEGEILQTTCIGDSLANMIFDTEEVK